MADTQTYRRKEKLKSRKLLNALFTGASSFAVFPVKVFYMPLTETTVHPIQAGVGVSARNFRKAVDRNRIKRLLRETYRLNKSLLPQPEGNTQKSLAVFFLYIGKELPEFTFLNEKMQTALTKLATQID